ncbi:MAG TPA: hypothetical protein VGE88_15095 [Lysobacter sp.]
MQDLNIELKLDRIRCHDEGDGPGNAEPYLWVVYFKVDGETIVVNTDGPNPPFLQGPPTIVPTPGNHGNLGVNDVDEGDEFAVPSIIGEYRTVMKPIPLTVPLLGKTEVGGMIGCIAVLMEEDNTPASAIARGHEALDRSVRDKLGEFLGTLSISKQDPTDEDIEALSDQIGDAVKGAIGDGVSVLQWIGAFGNMDDQVGSAVFRFTHGGLEAAGGAPIPFSRRWDNEGDWELFGHIRATPIPRREGCCDELRKRVNKLEATVARQGTKIALLERAYLSHAADEVAREPVRRGKVKARG